MQISLALGGGGVKGIAHIGVLRCLVENGYQIGSIAGTSAGGLVGAMYASGYDPDEIEDIIDSIDQSHLFGHSNGPALLGIQGLTHVLTGIIGERTFADLRIPFSCPAVDLTTAKEVIFTSGRVVDAILATIAVPAIFPPKEINGHLIVDGGVLDPVPVSLARWLTPSLPIIAVCLVPQPEEWAELPSLFQMPPTTPIPNQFVEQLSRMRVGRAFKIFLDSIDISTRSMAELRLKVDQPEVIIRPSVGQFGMLDHVNPKLLVEAGYQATQLSLPQIRKVLNWRQKIARKLQHPDPPGKPLENPDAAVAG